MLLALLLLGWQAAQRPDSGYTADENWAVHWSLYRQSQVGLPALVVQNVTQYASDNVLLDGWLWLFGLATAVTGHLSRLCLLLTLALLYRLTGDFFRSCEGLLAVVVFGSLALVQFWGAQVLPYAPAWMATTGLHLVFWRWLKRPHRRRAGLYVLLALLTAWIYPFGVYLILAQAAAGLILMRRQWRQAVLVLGAAVVLTLPRLLMTTDEAVLNGSTFASWRAPQLLALSWGLRPLEMFQLMFLLGLAIVAGMLNRVRAGYWLLVGAVVLAVEAGVYGGKLSLWLLLLPPLALLAGYTLSQLRRSVAVVTLSVFLLPILFAFRPFVGGLSDPQLATLIQADVGSKVVIAAPYLWQHLPWKDQLPPDHPVFHILSSDTPALAPDQSAANIAPPTLARLTAFADSPVIWYLAGGDWGVNDTVKTQLAQLYAPSRFIQNADDPTYGYQEIIRYQHIPQNLSDVFLFQDTESGGRLILKAWTLLDSVEVQPCQSVRLQSWWQAPAPLAVDASLTLTIVDNATGQGVAHTDAPPVGQLTTQFEPELLYLDERTVTLPCNAASGEYPLMLGLYHMLGSEIVAFETSLPDGTPLDKLAYLTTLFIH